MILFCSFKRQGVSVIEFIFQIIPLEEIDCEVQ